LTGSFLVVHIQISDDEFESTMDREREAEERDLGVKGRASKL